MPISDQLIIPGSEDLPGGSDPENIDSNTAIESDLRCQTHLENSGCARGLKPFIILFSVMLTACGGGSGDTVEEDFTQPPLIPTENTLSEESIAIDSDPANRMTSTTINGGEVRIIPVDSDSSVSLYVSSGDADLYLYDDFVDIDINSIGTVAAFDKNNWLCWSDWRFKEDVCTAQVDDGLMYAVIKAYADSEIELRVIDNCTDAVINRWVYRGLTDYYLFADQVPADVNPVEYDDATALISALRFKSRDSYSWIQDAAQSAAFFEDGIGFGLGHSWQRDADDNLRIRYVFADSPFGKAGIKRGDIAVSLEGEALATMSEERYFELTGTRNNPRVSQWEFIDGDANTSKSISVLIGEYKINTVLHSEVFVNETTGQNTGYIALSNFLETSIEELDDAITRLIATGIDDLILDFRYNGGGRSYVSRRLATQVGGNAVFDNLYARYQHNSNYSRFDENTYFLSSLNGPVLNLPRLMVLTTSSTASASESLINNLKPYIEVVTFGSTSDGKPFSSNGRTFCGKTLSLMQRESFNANGVSVEDGIMATCYAEDDLTRNFGTESGSIERMLLSAIRYISDGVCEVPLMLASRSAEREKNIPFLESPFIGNDMEALQRSR